MGFSRQTSLTVGKPLYLDFKQASNHIGTKQIKLVKKSLLCEVQRVFSTPIHAKLHVEVTCNKTTPTLLPALS